MSKISELHDIVIGFLFIENYDDMMNQFSEFAEKYAQLNIEEAKLLRDAYDSKNRLGWFSRGTNLFRRSFTNADYVEKEKLLKIFWFSEEFCGQPQAQRILALK